MLPNRQHILSKFFKVFNICLQNIQSCFSPQKAKCAINAAAILTIIVHPLIIYCYEHIHKSKIQPI